MKFNKNHTIIRTITTILLTIAAYIGLFTKQTVTVVDATPVDSAKTQQAINSNTSPSITATNTGNGDINNPFAVTNTGNGDVHINLGNAERIEQNNKTQKTSNHKPLAADKKEPIRPRHNIIQQQSITISGIVTDSVGKLLQNATVMLLNQKAKTDEDGRYSFILYNTKIDDSAIIIFKYKNKKDSKTIELNSNNYNVNISL